MTIRQIQCLLVYLGYDPGAIDGADGPQTRAAVKAFQAAEGLDPDGIAGPQTMAKLPEAVFLGHYAPVDNSGGGTDKQDTGTVWDGIEFFSRPEFKCKCGGKYCSGYPVEMDPEGLRVVDEIRRRAGVPLRVNSGLRCPGWNADPSVGGAVNSLHTTGRAVDLSGSISPEKLRAVAEEVTKELIPGRGGIGLYRWGIHVDTGAYSRWNG